MRVVLEEIADTKLSMLEKQTYIDRLVVEARREGCSWIQIARALGTTKQAAARKYSQLCSDPPPPGNGP